MELMCRQRPNINKNKQKKDPKKTLLYCNCVVFAGLHLAKHATTTHRGHLLLFQAATWQPDAYPKQNLWPNHIKNLCFENIKNRKSTLNREQQKAAQGYMKPSLEIKSCM